jgi:hypothetical protein
MGTQMVKIQSQIINWIFDLDLDWPCGDFGALINSEFVNTAKLFYLLILFGSLGERVVGLLCCCAVAVQVVLLDAVDFDMGRWHAAEARLRCICSRATLTQRGDSTMNACIRVRANNHPIGIFCSARVVPRRDTTRRGICA